MFTVKISRWKYKSKSGIVHAYPVSPGPGELVGNTSVGPNIWRAT